MKTQTAAKSVYIAEDSAPVRARLVEQLARIPDVVVVGEAATPADAIAGIVRTRPRYVVLDLQLEGGSGVDVLKAVRQQVAGTVFVVLTNHPQAQFRRICMDAGADVFLDKSTEFGKVTQVITGAHPKM